MAADERVITATGMNTEMGKMLRLLNNSDQQKHHYKSLNQLGKRISLLALGAAAIVFIIGELQGGTA